MQHEGVGIPAQFGDDERHPLRHQAGNEPDIAGQSVQLRNQDATLRGLGGGEGGCELRPAVDRVGALAGYRLDELRNDRQFGLGEPGDGRALRFEGRFKNLAPFGIVIGVEGSPCAALSSSEWQSLKEATMKPAALKLFGQLLVGFFLVAFGHGAQAQNVCGNNLGAQAKGTIGSMVEEGGALSIIPRGDYEKSCPRISALRYIGARALLSDCKVGKPFIIVGGLRPKDGNYVLEGDVIRCDAVAAPASASEATVVSPQIRARVERLNQAFSGVSLTTYSNLQGFLPQGTWNKVLIRGRAITMDARAGLRLKYETCESGTLVQRQRKSNPIVTTRSSCTAAGDWKARDTEYRLVAIKLPTIGVREKSAPAGSNWFEIEFSGVDTAQSGFIACSGRQACESMAEDLRGLVTVAHTLRDTLARINQAYNGLVFQQAGKQGEPRIAVVKMEAVRANFETMHTLQQACVRRPDQDCDRDQLWRERMALVDLSKLALEVTLDETRDVSDDKAVGAAIVKCAGDGCWDVRLGGSGGNIRSGRPTDAIHCRIGEGCREMKRELEQLVALLQGKGPVSDAPPDAIAKPSLRPRSGPIWVKMETDGTIVVQDAPPHLMQTIGQPPRRTFPPSHPRYNYVLRTLGPFTPGDDFRQTLSVFLE
jgi:hypothetical protein